MSTSLKNEVGRKPNGPHMLREASPSSFSSGSTWATEGRLLIRIPDLSGAAPDPSGSRKVQRLIDVLKVLRNRPRSLVASGIVLAGAILVTAVLTWRQEPATQQLTTAPEYSPLVHAPRRVNSPGASMSVELPTAPEVLTEVPAAPLPGADPPLLGPSLEIQPPAESQFAMPGVARLLGEIVPDTIEEAKHESSGPGLH